MLRICTVSALFVLATVASDAHGQNATRRPAARAATTPTQSKPTSTKPATTKPATTKPTAAKPEASPAKAEARSTTSKQTATKLEADSLSATTATPPVATTPVTASRRVVPIVRDSAVKTARTLMLSVNPLGLLYGGLTGEAEKRLNPKNTIAAAVNYWGASLANYTSVDLKYRIYQNPSNEFRGLSYGPMIGFQRVGYALCDLEFDDVCSTTGLTLGGTVDYVVPFGKEERWTAAFGGGVKTSLGMEQLSGVTFTYPFIRVGIGYTFPKK